ncbi:hypothetical protein [Egicoccus sp. AB-alg2]|uniref:hypothetical protein n=1 Tax=Egicoccus sp. AB-alg2 TaxID=3242693 RepID=UPI00359E6B93
MGVADEVAVRQAAATGWVERDLRRLAAAATAGLVVGFLVNGVGSRLAMLLLARLNPQATGRISDDGFRMGQFGLAETLDLVTFGVAIGVLGGVIFLVVRGLRFGPRWFRTSSMVVGPAVVVGALLVHTGGVDFTLLQPAWLSIALFVALPAMYAYAVVRLGDRWLREDSWFLTGSRWALLGLVPLVLAGPGLVLLLPVLIGHLAHRSVPTLRRPAVGRTTALVARGALVLVFAVGLVDLVRDTVRLV